MYDHETLMRQKMKMKMKISCFVKNGGKGRRVSGSNRQDVLCSLLQNIFVLTHFLTYSRPAKRSNNFIIEFPPLPNIMILIFLVSYIMKHPQH